MRPPRTPREYYGLIRSLIKGIIEYFDPPDAVIGCLVDRRPHDLVQEAENLVDEPIGGGRGDIGRAQRRRAMHPRNVVEVEVDDRELVQAHELGNQVATACSGRRSEAAVPVFAQRLDNCDAGSGNEPADKRLETASAGGGFACGPGKCVDGGGGGGVMHGTSLEARRRAGELIEGEGRRVEARKKNAPARLASALQLTNRAKEADCIGPARRQNLSERA